MAQKQTRNYTPYCNDFDIKSMYCIIRYNVTLCFLFHETVNAFYTRMFHEGQATNYVSFVASSDRSSPLAIDFP